MKILSFLIISLIINFTVSAQSSKDSSMDQNHQNANSQPQHDQYYQMQNGKLVMYSHGVKNALIMDVTLPDGTTITTDGKVTWKNRKTQTLQDGESIDMSGKIQHLNKTQMNNQDRNSADSSIQMK